MISKESEDFFRNRILRTLFEYQEQMNENANEFSFQSDNFEQRNKYMLSNEIEKVHSNLIYKIKNLENVHKSMAKQKEGTHMTQDLVEEFILTCNKSKECECALNLINVLKICNEQQTMIFHNIFGESFIAKMKSRIDARTFKPKEMGDPEPEIPDDLEFSGDSASIRFNFKPETEFVRRFETFDKQVQTEIKGVNNKLNISINEDMEILKNEKEETKQEKSKKLK